MKDVELIQKYKSSYTGAFWNIAPHALLFSSELAFIYHNRHSVVSWLAVPLFSLSMMKNFVIFHDCGHNSFTPSPTINRITAHVLATVTFSNARWAENHELHHSSNGRIDNDLGANFNELNFLTLSQLKTFSPTKLFFFTLFQNPLVRFFIFPVIYFMVWHRQYADATSMLHNALLIEFARTLFRSGILWHYATAMCIFAIGTFAIFHNQHTFNESTAMTGKWSKRDGALKHTSVIRFPSFMTHFTNGIEYHHIHHLYSKIPGYNLKNFHDEFKSDPVTLTPYQCFCNLWLAAYDEENGKYLTLKEIQQALSLSSTN